MKIGDLVRRFDNKVGVVMEVRTYYGVAKVIWINAKRGVWHPIKSLEAINENR